MIVLNGITWDHDRGLLPLLETTKNFHKLYPDIDIRWKKRTLKEFGDFPVEELAKEYDLLLIDHPFSGEAYEHNILIDYNRYMSAEELQIRQEQELGKTHRCYNYNGKQMALSVDIAAMVSAYRADLLEARGIPVPGSLDEVIELAGRTGKVEATLVTTDIWCIFLIFGA
ncbi:MAG: carbohydrate ABC transporter substrate-binding protein, partial [Clostridiales bacterium]|nr:carbohydrate ABC transporter substrate-binding protein [Clostridiales bacterium]